MNKVRSLVALLLVLVTAAWFTPKTITPAVPGMTCSTCPITVQKALTKVPGVMSWISVDSETREGSEPRRAT